MGEIIAIDGPASVGKSTIAKKIANKYNSPILFSGRLYRAVALAIIKNKVDLENNKSILRIIESIDYNDLSSHELFTSQVDKVSSEISTKPFLRKRLLKYQREFPKRFGKGKKFVVIEGRDIASVVFPRAKYKIFMWADSAIRAKRRYQQVQKNGGKSRYKKILTEINTRDKKDFTRTIAPLKPDVNSVLIDTSYLDIEQVFNVVKDILSNKRL